MRLVTVGMAGAVCAMVACVPPSMIERQVVPGRASLVLPDPDSIEVGDKILGVEECESWDAWYFFSRLILGEERKRSNEELRSTALQNTLLSGKVTYDGALLLATIEEEQRKDLPLIVVNNVSGRYCVTPVARGINFKYSTRKEASHD